MSREEDFIFGSFCIVCGRSHAMSARLRAVRGAMPVSIAEMSDRWPCWFPRDRSGYKAAIRDLNRIGAESDLPGSPFGEWSIPGGGN